MNNSDKRMEPDTSGGVTLAAVLSLLRPYDHVFIERSIGLHELEAVGEGTVQELQTIKRSVGLGRKTGGICLLNRNPCLSLRETALAANVTDEGEVITGRRSLLSDQNTLCEVAFIPHWKNCPDARRFRRK